MNEKYSLAEKRELGELIVKHKKKYDKELKNLEGNTHYDYKRKKHLPMKPKRGFLATAVVVSSVYFSPRVNISFQLSISRSYFLKICLQLCSYIGKF